jgi:hypothetical protein
VNPRELPADIAVFARYIPALRSLPETGRVWSDMAVTEALDGLEAVQGISVTRSGLE